ncbi:hypothetical protein ABZ835_46465 [Streptomyces sp. NPDC047461]|uniref:hypothetical protein n=1 Tax=Streptomyces sp. NPDC047461 TaxID=3155619 RepID=UPI003409B9D0
MRAIRAARRGARFALIGALSGQLSLKPDGNGASASAEIDTFRITTPGITLQGFSSADLSQATDEWNERFGDWLRSGEIVFPYVRIPGIDRAPGVLQELVEGRHTDVTWNRAGRG